MKKVLYVSPLPKDSQTGGANAVNYHTYAQLQRYFDCTYVQINPKEPRLGQWISQLIRKVLKQPGRFNFFSQQRLKAISKAFEAITGTYDCVFFRGFTPWVLCEPKMPYVAYNDVHFLQFFKNTFPQQEFNKKDIARICSAEQLWLSKAKTVLFESQWGAEQCINDYKLDTLKLIAIGRGGNVPIPNTDVYDGALNLVVIANNFYQKGGDLVFEAFKQLKPQYKDLELHVVGGTPGDAAEATPGVVYHGYLYKETPKDLERLVAVLSTAFLLMHVTREDVNPLVPTEAGYFGCPTVSVQHFAIPELVQDGQTGVLLPYLPSVNLVADAISTLINNKTSYTAMRKATWDYNHRHYKWDAIGEKLSHIFAP